MLKLIFLTLPILFSIVAHGQVASDDCGPNEITQDLPTDDQYVSLGKIKGNELFWSQRRSSDVVQVDLKVVPPEGAAVTQTLICAIGENYEHEKPVIKGDKLFLVSVVPERYVPGWGINKYTFAIQKDLSFKRISLSQSEPYAEAVKGFPALKKKKNLEAMVASRDLIVPANAGSYLAADYISESSKVCFDTLKVGYEKAKTAFGKGDLEETKKILQLFKPFRGERNDEHPCFSSWHRESINEACEFRQGDSCYEISKSEVELLNNTAFLMSKVGMNDGALRYLNVVLEWQPTRRVAYENFADVFSGLQKKEFSQMSKAIAVALGGRVTKTTSVPVEDTTLNPIAESLKLSCADGQTLKADITGMTLAPSFQVKCVEGNNKKSILFWNPTMDEVDASMKLCPISKAKVALEKPAEWSKEKQGGFLGILLKNCGDISAAIQLPNCRWAVACAGGLDHNGRKDEESMTGITDFALVDELEGKVEKLRRSSGTEIELVPEKRDLIVNEKIEFQDSYAQRPVLNAAWRLQCDEQDCKPSKYECEKSETGTLQFRTMGIMYDEDSIFSLALQLAITTNDFRKDFKPGKRVSYPRDSSFVDIDVDAIAATGRSCRK